MLKPVRFVGAYILFWTMALLVVTGSRIHSCLLPYLKTPLKALHVTLLRQFSCCSSS